MNKLIRLLTGAALTLVATLTADVYAQTANYPNFYLRGAKTSWGCDEQYKFTRTGARYYLYFSNYSGEAKISNEDWSINYGAPQEGSSEIYSFGEYTGLHDGRNWILGLPENKDITVSFVYDAKNSSTANVTFYEGKVEFEEEPDPIFDPSTLASGTLPILFINVYTDETHSTLDNEIIDKDLSHKNYFSNAEYWLDIKGCDWIEGAANVGSKDAPLPLEIKARGNYTRTGFAKKPFKLKLGKKQNLLNMTPSKSKHYAILAHADDYRGYLRNFTGFNLGKRIGLPWTPSQQPIEVIINGDYRGVYFLTESIRVGDGRVPITELDDNVSDPALISGGYLVELDNYDEENQIRFEEKPYANVDPMVRVTFDTPEVYSDLQYQFIKDQFETINNMVGDRSSDLWSYLDQDDLVRYYLVEEILGHTESFHGSTYLYRDRGEGQKWHFSPLWDCGNAFNAYSDQFLYNSVTFGNTWIHTIANMPEFRSKVEATWKWFMSNGFNGLYEDMKSYTDLLKTAAEYDYKRWNNAPRPNSWNASGVADNRDMDGKYKEVTDYLKNRVNWLKGQFGDFSGYFAEPERDTTPAAALPSYVITDVEVVEIAAPQTENVEYYTLEGFKVEKPNKGIYIKVVNGEATKVAI